MFTFSISNSERFLGRYRLIRWDGMSMWQRVPLPDGWERYGYPLHNPFYEGDVQLKIERFKKPFDLAVFLKEDLTCEQHT